MSNAIAIIGMACRYPDAGSPCELWENALAQRRAFRRIPSERLRLSDYFSADPHASDTTYCREAAVIEGYEFDRVRFRVAGDTYRSVDLAHWLALDVASQALSDAGFSDGGLPKQTTGVIVGNTLTGEFSRASNLRLRWPFVRRVIEPALTNRGWSPKQRSQLLEEVEVAYKAPFPAVGEETLAGSLSNTIAGRICNYFDLKGGGYTIDGACASSLLAITNACSALAVGDLDLALAGGVDLSLDPFELVGFAKVSALASGDMRVYDLRSSGFLPGEGCGFVVLMRLEDALAQGRKVYALIKGWAVSSDGSGGITRPEVGGQLLALRRAYRRAGFGINTVSYFEGHGTGTSVGDATELRALLHALCEAGADASTAVIGSIKANIGHTKSAAGVAGLIKATLALSTQVLPPTTGCEEPHPMLRENRDVLTVLREAKTWPASHPLRAGVSAMGFGGINTHVVLEAQPVERRESLGLRERTLARSAQDAEMFLLGAHTRQELQLQAKHLLVIAPRLSRFELTDLAAHLADVLDMQQVRAAVVASTPVELESRLATLYAWLADGVDARLDARAGLFLGDGLSPPRIGFLFPGQGSPLRVSGGALRRRFEFIEELYAGADFPGECDHTSTLLAQPAIITATLAGLRVLRSLAINATVGIGHSLGEMAALHWAGAFDEECLLRLVVARSEAMAELGSSNGAMASIRAGGKDVEAFLNGHRVVIAALNSPLQTVISGEADAVDAVVARLNSVGIHCAKLPVSHAFHSPLVQAAAPRFRDCLERENFVPLSKKVVSTVTGTALAREADLKSLLDRQVISPVRFQDAMTIAAGEADLFIEIGPGEVLSELLRDSTSLPVVAMDSGGPSLKGVLNAFGAAYALGACVETKKLFDDRLTKPFDLHWNPRFFKNPCELAPAVDTSAQDGGEETRRHGGVGAKVTDGYQTAADEVAPRPDAQSNSSVLEFVRQIIAERAELPPTVVKDDNRLLSDLHLNSITVSQIIAEMARHLRLGRLSSLTDFADATVAEVAQLLSEFSSVAGPRGLEKENGLPPGVDTWVRTFTVNMVESPPPRRQAAHLSGPCKIYASPGHPLAGLLQGHLGGWGAGGTVVVCLPPDPDERQVDMLLEAARAVLDEPGPARFVLVQHGGGAAAFAKTLHLETPGLTTCVIDVPPTSQAIEWIISEAKAARGFVEAHYDEAGMRRQPFLRLLNTCEAQSDIPLGFGDGLLVTGGGKGITAECSFALAKGTGAKLVLLGTSRPEADRELESNLSRLEASGISFRYYAADITDAAAVRAAVSDAVKTFGPIKGILHGAAVNKPQSVRSMDREEFHKTVAIKVHGLRNVLAAVDCLRLKLLITFGSIIGRSGLPGEAHYALANEWLTRETEQFRKDNPHCKCLALEWSVWSDVGMARRAGTVERLVAAGITPITPDHGVSTLKRLTAADLPVTPVIIAGRCGDLPTLKFERPELPLLRFLEAPRVYYPGVELLADSQLSIDTDHYLPDHTYQGERLLPAVMGLEAMAQVAMALTGSTRSPVFEQVKFLRPIIVPDKRPISIRVAALVREPGQVDVVVRSLETEFQVDHFSAVCTFSNHPEFEAERSFDHRAESELLALDPEQDLYGPILFHKGRFKRLRGYRQLKAKGCIAEIAPGRSNDWFDYRLPSSLLLGDPAARDAAIHCIQACIPHATLLPVGVDKIVTKVLEGSQTLYARACELSSDGESFTYDLEIMAEDGSVIETWSGLRLRTVGARKRQQSWALPLLCPYVERRIGELIPGALISVSLSRGSGEGRRERSYRALRLAVGQGAMTIRRSGGNPEVLTGGSASVSHAGPLTFAVAGRQTVACDIKTVKARSITLWSDLLGPERLKLANLLARETGEDLDSAASRARTATECLKKCGSMAGAPLNFRSSTLDGWVLLSSGRIHIATYKTAVEGSDDDLALAVLTEGEPIS